MTPTVPGALPPPTAVRQNPFVGPRPFGRKDTIHGRDSEIEQIRGLLTAQRIVLVYSPSGAGKSSLIEAGLRPKLEQAELAARRFYVPPTIRVAHELPEPAGNGNRYSASVIASLEERERDPSQPPDDHPPATTLGEYLPRLADEHPGVRICLVFDQFEEVFTLSATDDEAKHAFFEDLGEALSDRRFWALFAMREDFIARLDPYVTHLPTRLRTRSRIDLLPWQRAKEVVQATAEPDVVFEDEAAISVVDDLRRIQVQHDDQVRPELGPTVEPLQLQVVCRRLWDGLAPSATRIGLADVRDLNVDGALADYYDDEIHGTISDTGVGELDLRNWFDTQLTTDDGYRRQVRFGPGRDGQQVLDRLENAYLIRKDIRQGVPWYELTHDRFVTPIRDSNRAFYAERRATTLKRRGIAAGVLAVIVGAVIAIVLVVTRPETTALTATDADIPSTHEVTLDPGGFERYRIRPVEGEPFTATLETRASTTKAQLRLFNVEDGELGSEIVTVDLSTGTQDSKTQNGNGAATSGSETAAAAIQHTAMGSGAELIVEVSSQSGGSFGLVIAEDQTSTGGPPVLRVGDEPVEGAVATAGQIVNHSLDGREGDALRIIVTPADDTDTGLDPIISLRDPDGTEVGYQDIGVDGQAESLSATLGTTGTFTVDVAGFQTSTGDYTISVEPFDTTPLPADGTRVPGSVDTAGAIVTYSIDAQEGDQLRITVTPTDDTDTGFDPILILKDPDGFETGYSDNGVGGQAESTSMTVATAGTFTVDVSGYEDSTGDYTISAEPFDTTPLEPDGAPVDGEITDVEPAAAYRVETPGGVSEGVIEVMPDGNFDPVLQIVTDFGGFPIDDAGPGEPEVFDVAEFGYLEVDSIVAEVSGFEGSIGRFQIRVSDVS